MAAKKYSSAGKSAQVAEPAVAYQVRTRYQESYGRPEVKLQVIRAGLEPDALAAFMEMFNGTQEDVARLLNISDKTLRSYIRDSKNLNIGISEHLIQLFELFDKGITIFGNPGEFRTWLNLANVGLGEKPVNLLDSLIGIECVMDELSRIEYGALA